MGRAPGCVHLVIHRRPNGTHVCVGCGQLFVAAQMAEDVLKVLEVEVREYLTVSMSVPRQAEAAVRKAAERHGVTLQLPFEAE